MEHLEIEGLPVERVVTPSPNRDEGMAERVGFGLSLSLESL
jgi:hypothetical protein